MAGCLTRRRPRVSNQPSYHRIKVLQVDLEVQGPRDDFHHKLAATGWSNSLFNGLHKVLTQLPKSQCPCSVLRLLQDVALRKGRSHNREPLVQRTMSMADFTKEVLAASKPQSIFTRHESPGYLHLMPRIPYLLPPTNSLRQGSEMSSPSMIQKEPSSGSCPPSPSCLSATARTTQEEPKVQ